MPPSGDGFETTHWTMVIRAADQGSPQGRAALAELFRTYHVPIRRHIGRKVRDPALADDLTQAFFADLLERNDLAAVDRSRGRLRAYLVTAADHLIINARARERALKRGGGQAPVALDDETLERHPERDDLDPERRYDRDVALALVDRAAEVLEQRWTQKGRAHRFAVLSRFLRHPPEPGDYKAAAEALDLEPNAVEVAVSRLRASLRSVTHELLADHVPPDQLDDELRALAAALEG